MASSMSGRTSSSTRPWWWERSRRSSAPCRGKSWRPCSSTTRSTSRCSRRVRSSRFAALTNSDGQAARAHRSQHGARGGGAASRRVLLLEGGPQTAAREPRGRPGRRHLPPGPGKLPRQDESDGRRSWRQWGATRHSPREAREAARQAARLAKADLTTAMVREFPELQGVDGGPLPRGRKERPARSGGRSALALPSGLGRGDAALPAGKLSPVGARQSSPRSPWSTSSTPWPATSDWGWSRRGAAIPSACGGRGRDCCASCWTSGRRVQGAEPQRPPARGASSATGPCLERPAGKTVAFPEAIPARAARVPSRGSGLPGRGGRGGPGAHRRSRRPRRCARLPARLEALHQRPRRAPEDFEHLAVAFKRAKNILTKEAGAGAIEPALFEHDAERELYAAVERLRGGKRKLRRRASGRLAGLRKPVDRFFDDVLVMAEDANVRGNRLALLHRTLSLFYRIADISRLGGQA